MLAGKIPADAEQASLRPRDFEEASKTICGSSSSTVARQYPTTDAKDVPFLCMDLCFITALLEDGFGIQSEATLQLAQKLPFNGEAIETQWPLGASLEELGEELAKLGL
jgi:Golgi nucleoside diphosphatase